jgi:hypothetical protein
MVYSQIHPVTKKEMYIRRFGNSYLFTYDKKGAEDNIPDGWEVVKTKDRLFLKRK